MPLKELSLHERAVIKQCLNVMAAGEVIEHSLLHTLCGVTPAYFVDLAEAWPLIDDSLPNVFLAINGALNNLLGYPHGRDDIWQSLIHADRAEIERIYLAWRKGFSESS